MASQRKTCYRYVHDAKAEENSHLPDTQLEHLRIVIHEQREKVRVQVTLLRGLEDTYRQLGGNPDEIGETPPELQVPLGPGAAKLTPRQKIWQDSEMKLRQSAVMKAWHAAKKNKTPFTADMKKQALAAAVKRPK